MSKLKTEKVLNPNSVVDTITFNTNGSCLVAGTVSATERTITAGTFDMSTGNYWTCGAIAIPNPTNAVAGTSGLIRVTAAPTSFGGNFDFPDGAGYVAPTAFPAIIPYYVVSSSQILLGNWVEGIV
jgi:hypothetical protein